MLRVTAEGFLLTLYLGIPLDVWLAAWVATGRGGEEYRTAFLRLYHAEIGTMLVDELEIDAVVPGAGYEGWWAELVAWLLDPGAACLDGCTQSQRPV